MQECVILDGFAMAIFVVIACISDVVFSAEGGVDAVLPNQSGSAAAKGMTGHVGLESAVTMRRPYLPSRPEA